MYTVGYWLGATLWRIGLPVALVWLAVASGWRSFRAGFGQGIAGRR